MITFFLYFIFTEKETFIYQYIYFLFLLIFYFLNNLLINKKITKCFVIINNQNNFKIKLICIHVFDPIVSMLRKVNIILKI